MTKMLNIVHYLLRMAAKSIDWEKTQQEIHGHLLKKGFDSEEIDLAISIASRFKDRLASHEPIVIPKPTSQLFLLMENWRIAPEARGFLIALREQGRLSEKERQVVIESAMQVDTPEIDLELMQELVEQLCDSSVSSREFREDFAIH